MCLCLAAPCFADTRIGVQTLTVDDLGDGRTLSLSVWYPAEKGGQPEAVGRNAVFLGQAAYRGAIPQSTRHPLVMLSHGGLRSAPDSGAWLAGRLAQAGFVAIEVNGPRPRLALEAVDEIWRRPQDVSHAIDRVLADKVWSDLVDGQRIAVVGHALGGTAALALAGGRIDALSYVRSCDDERHDADCAWYAAQEVSLDRVDIAQMHSALRDPRIAAAIALNPEYSEAFLPGSLGALDAKSAQIRLGDQSAAPIAGADLRFVAVKEGVQFDAFSLCTEQGLAILAEDGGDTALCRSGADQRSRVHDQIANQIILFLTQ
jgi:predicted dienelactone hydrolase